MFLIFQGQSLLFPEGLFPWAGPSSPLLPWFVLPSTPSASPPLLAERSHLPPSYGCCLFLSSYHNPVLSWKTPGRHSCTHHPFKSLNKTRKGWLKADSSFPMLLQKYRQHYKRVQLWHSCYSFHFKQKGRKPQCSDGALGSSRSRKGDLQPGAGRELPPETHHPCCTAPAGWAQGYYRIDLKCQNPENAEDFWQFSTLLPLDASHKDGLLDYCKTSSKHQIFPVSF